MKLFTELGKTLSDVIAVGGSIAAGATKDGTEFLSHRVSDAGKVVDVVLNGSFNIVKGAGEDIIDGGKQVISKGKEVVDSVMKEVKSTVEQKAQQTLTPEQTAQANALQKEYETEVSALQKKYLDKAKNAVNPQQNVAGL
jgi:phage-related protein